MSIGLGVTDFDYSANGLNLNQAGGTRLHTVFAAKPLQIQRYGVVSEASQGLLAPMRLKLQTSTDGGASWSDVTDADDILNPDGAQSRGVPVNKDMDGRVTIEAGTLVAIAIDTAAGGTSTGRVWLEYQQLPFAGNKVPDKAVESA